MTSIEQFRKSRIIYAKQGVSFNDVYSMYKALNNGKDLSEKLIQGLKNLWNSGDRQGLISLYNTTKKETEDKRQSALLDANTQLKDQLKTIATPTIKEVSSIPTREAMKLNDEKDLKRDLAKTKRWSDRLKRAAKLFNGKISGYDFNKFEDVVRFLRNNKLKVDGLVGQDTWTALNKAANTKYTFNTLRTNPLRVIKNDSTLDKSKEKETKNKQELKTDNSSRIYNITVKGEPFKGTRELAIKKYGEGIIKYLDSADRNIGSQVDSRTIKNSSWQTSSNPLKDLDKVLYNIETEDNKYTGELSINFFPIADGYNRGMAFEYINPGQSNTSFTIVPNDNLFVDASNREFIENVDPEYVKIMRERYKALLIAIANGWNLVPGLTYDEQLRAFNNDPINSKISLPTANDYLDIIYLNLFKTSPYIYNINNPFETK